jgi:hypothetical protein
MNRGDIFKSDIDILIEELEWGDGQVSAAARRAKKRILAREVAEQEMHKEAMDAVMEAEHD